MGVLGTQWSPTHPSVAGKGLVERWAAAGSVPVLSTGVDGPPSSSGLGHHPFKVAARVRIPLGVHIHATGPVVKSGVHAGLSSRRSRVQIPSGPHNTVE